MNKWSYLRVVLFVSGYCILLFDMTLGNGSIIT